DVFYDLSVPLPPKGTPAKSVSSPPQNERCISQQKTHMELFPAIDKTNTEKIHVISEVGDPQFPASESEDMVMVKTSEPLGVDSDKLEQILQSKDDVHDPLQTPIRKENMLIVSSGDVEKTNSSVVDNAFNVLEASIEAKMDTFYGEVDTQDKGKARNLDEVEDIYSLGSIEKCMELHFKAETIGWTCENCSKVAQKASTISGKDGEQIMASTIANGTIDGDQVEQSDRNSCQSELSNDLIRLAVECTSSSMQSHGNDAHHQVMPSVDIKIEGDTPGMSCDEKDWSSCSIANKKPECLEGAQEDVLFYGQYQNASIQDVRKGKQVNLAHSAHQVEENQYDRQDSNVHAIQTLLITKLPPVLAIHLNRCLGPLKVSGHVCFEEILDVGQFMHPSSEDKDNSRYRLVGVVEHQGLGTDIGHFVAYFRPNAMEEEKRARAGNRATAECPRKGKAPRMEPPPVVLDADDSGCGGNSSLEVSDPTLAAIRDTDGEECEHMICKGHDIAEIVSKIASSEGTTMCEDETCLATGSHLMMVCSECDSHFCIGRSADKARPRGHIGEHALLDGHWVAVWYEDPYVGYCFECEDSLTIGGEEGKKGMIVKGEEGRRASGFANEHGCVIRGIPNLGNTCYLNAVLQCLLLLEKLWARMSRLNAPLGILGGILHDLFVHTDSTPIRIENAMIASGHDIERTYSAFLDNVFNGPEVSIEAKMDTFSAEVTTEGKGKARNRDAVYDEAEDINSLASIEECLELHFEEEMIDWRCENCFKVAHKASTISGKDGEQMMSSTNVTRKVDGDQAEESERKTCQCAQEDVPSCCPAEKQANLFSGQCRNASTQDQGKGKEVNLGHNAQEVEENQYDLQDRKVGAIQKHLISKLPPVLAIHLKRSLGPLKVSGHVSFKEILDVEPFMDPSSEDIDNSSYRLVGVVEHQGLATDIGHYVAYVRPSHQQHNSRSSSWFCASDENIKDISLEVVLKCEAYLLFYERMEG
ncbi:hypothetical protein E2562_001826, partial [Oryza meyeriana var. granulata]